MSAQKAIAIFNSVCAGGEAKFAKDEIKAVSSMSLPNAARKLAQISLWPEGKPSLEVDLKPEDLPESVYALVGKPKVFLTSPMVSPNNPIQASCSVFSKGEFFEEVSLYASEKSAQPYLKLENQMMVSYDFGEFRIVAATYSGWTQLSMVPADDGIAAAETDQG